MAPRQNSITHGDAMMALIIDALAAADKMPSSRELALVKTKLDEAIMWGHRALMGLRPAVNEERASAPKPEIRVDRATLGIVAEAVDTYLRMTEGKEPPPGQNPVDVIEAAVRETCSQRGNAVAPNIRLICSEVLTARLRKEGV